MTGWVKLYRSITKWEWYKDKNVRLIFQHLILTANIETKTWRGHQIKRGQLITTIENLGYENGLTTQETRTALKKLSATGEITTKPTNKFTLITIENFEKFQDVYTSNNKQGTIIHTYEEQAKPIQNTPPATTTKESQNQEEQEGKKEKVKKKETPTPSSNLFFKEKQEKEILNGDNFEPIPLDWWPERKLCKLCNEEGLSDQVISDTRERYISICNREGFTYKSLDYGFLMFIKTYINDRLKAGGYSMGQVNRMTDDFIEKCRPLCRGHFMPKNSKKKKGEHK